MKQVYHAVNHNVLLHGFTFEHSCPQMEVLSGEVTELSRHSIYLTDIGPQWVDFETVSADTGKLVG